MLNLDIIFSFGVLNNINGLIPCKESIKFKQRLDESLQKLNKRLDNYEINTPSYSTLQQQIRRINTRFDKYNNQGLLCGNDGLPHLISDASFTHAGEFVKPSLLFLYIAGWIGWAGRSYLRYTKKTNNPSNKEIIIDLPIALGMMTSGFLWPLLSWNELIANKLSVQFL